MPSQLVAYSGFSAANYIQEPYSADLDYGTGEFSLAAWVSVPATLPSSNFPSVGAEVSIGTVNYLGSWVNNGGGVFTSSTTGAMSILAPTLVQGKYYRVSVYVDNYTGGSFRVGLDASYSAYVTPTNNAVTTFELLGGSQNADDLYIESSAFAGRISAISIKEVGSALIADRSAATGPSIKLGVDRTGKLTATAFDGTTTRTVTTPAAYNTGIFTKVRATYIAGKLAITVNGVEVASATGTPLLTMNNAAATLTIGNSRTLDAPFPGSITMLKLGATVPTPEQATFMYEQEKHMFRPDAQITLPASSAVLDLAYDEAQDKWMAVQAGYESSFTGLIRTSAAVPSAGSFAKVVAGSGVKALTRTTTNPGVDIVIPAYGLREELVRRAEAAAKQSKTLTVFDFDAITAQTDFVLPVGWTAASVVSAGNTQREGATKNFTRLYDGFRETIRFAVAPGAAVWVRINAIKE